ncbi:MAG: hypothetical protein J6S67_11490 [Methanobrevibacter sp.]|nr:hypothetical protein [Methanobrevibacter sp.]
MITEDYISFEIAKLLKEKGFDEPCRTYYQDEKFVDDVCTQYYQWNNKSPFGHISAPTHQMVNKWIRKTYNIYIDVILLDKEDGDYGYVIQDIITRKYINTSNNNSYEFPEKAFEEALKFLFKNVI